MESEAGHLLYPCMSSGRFRPTPVAEDLESNVIRDSWQRCIEFELDPDQVPKAVNTSSQELRALLDQESYLVQLARAEFRKLQNQLPGDNCVFGLANRDAVLIDIACSNPAVSSASRALPGSCWNEKIRGTNAIGTAAFNRSPVFVKPQDHFLSHYNALSCLAVPVSDPDGEMAGVLHVASNSPIRQQPTMTLLCMAALHIELELFKDRYRSDIVLQFHGRDEFANTLEAGLMAVDDDGKILSTNRKARYFLEGLPAKPGNHFNEVFRTPFRQFISRSQTADAPVRLVDINGSSSIVHLHAAKSQIKNRMLALGKSAEAARANCRTEFVCGDPVVSHAVSLVRRAVALSVPILVRGETGTGKEMLAQYAHQLSGRRGRFIAVNCAAVPESLIESELFGYREGAFTGAQSGGAEGLILQANGGTLLLDEIGDMPMNLQPALLRFLDSWTVRPLGSNREVRVDVQLIASTNCELEAAIEEKRFRRDLLHRINGVEISLPPLRERSDFEEIVRDILTRISPNTGIEEGAVECLREQPWTGNMRELKNVLVRAMLFCTEPNLSARALGPFLQKHSPTMDVQGPESQELHDLRRKAIVNAYHRNKGNISKSAQSLSISRNTVYRELRLAGLIKSGSRVHA